MSKTINLGRVTAYADAVAAGYTGTREQFANDLANAANYAAEAGDAAETATEAATTASTAAGTATTKAEEASADADQAHADAQAILGAKETAVAAAATATSKAGEAANSAQQAAASETAAAGSATTASNAATSATASKNAAATSETNAANSAAAAAQTLTNVNQAGANQVAAIQAKGTQVLNSIPADYTELSNDVDDLKSDITEKLELVDVPASANLWDASNVSTGLLHTNGQVYTGESYDSYCYYDIGEVAQGDVLTSYIVQNDVVSALSMERVVAYDASDNVMASSGAVYVSTFTVPSGVARISVTILKVYSAKNYMVLKNASSAPTEYIPYAEGYSYYIATDEFMPTGFADGFVERDGDKQVTAKNAEFMFYSPNLIDESTLIDGYYVNQTNGQLAENAIHTVTDWIEVEGGQQYVISNYTMRDYRYCFYTADKTYIRGEYLANVTAEVLTAPSYAKYFRCSTTQFTQSYTQFEKGNSRTPYSVYSTAYLLEQYAPRGENAVINLPSKIYALTGYELNIYFENLTEDWKRYSWNVDCTKGMQLERGYRITPTNADAGSYFLTITATDSTGTITTASTTLVVTASTAGSGVTDTLIVLGDSTTNNGVAVTKLAENFSNDVMNLTEYGTRGTAPYKHEGRSGWTFNAYFNPPNAGDIALGVENPFYNPSTQTFDASYYFANSGVSVPNWFFINLGINDTFSYTTDTSLESAITTIKGLCDDMIASLKAAAPNMKIGLCLTIPPNHSQDAFGKVYYCGQTRNRYKRNNVLWVNDLIESYDGRESENLYLIPIYTNLDTVYNMGLETLPVNARNTAVTYESPVGNGGVHPVESGYWQIADVYTAFLKAYAD